MASPIIVRSSEPETNFHFVKLTGAGAAVPTSNLSASIAVTRNGVGDLSFTWTHLPGEYEGHFFGFSGNTVTDVDGWTFVVDRDAVTSKVVRGTIFNEATAGTAADLPTNCGLLLCFVFKTTSVKG